MQVNDNSSEEEAREAQLTFIREALAEFEVHIHGRTAAKDDIARRNEARRYMRRLIGAGNGGGVVATLGLFGATLGSSAANKGPRELLIVLAIFVAGLVASGLSAFFHARSADKWTEFMAYFAMGNYALRPIVDSASPGNMSRIKDNLDRALVAFNEEPKWSARENHAFLASVGAFSVGLVLSGFVLWSMARWFFFQCEPIATLHSM